ncbi:hypothetical protein [Salinigranum salinum]|uniref:hypothetical protein n=1 Tax=Salinigranum salinum TaxID=1364937 RepID=UPI0012606844|nr:hypothetical protein [Salinigranum salinum]
MSSGETTRTGESFGTTEATGYATQLWSSTTVKRGILLFWGAWISLVTLTNVFDGLKALGVLGSGWSFASGNYAFMLDTTSVHGTPESVVALLFVGVVVWEVLVAGLFWRAFVQFRGARSGLEPVYQAFVPSLALFATFMLMTEVFIAYGVESTHMRIFIAQLVSLYVIHQLPE